MTQSECTAQRLVIAGIQTNGARVDDSGNFVNSCSDTLTGAAWPQPNWTRRIDHVYSFPIEDITDSNLPRCSTSDGVRGARTLEEPMHRGRS